MNFNSRREAKTGATHHPGSPIAEIGPGGKRASKKPEATAVKTSTVT